MAGSMNYEAIDGSRCQVSIDEPASLDLRMSGDTASSTGLYPGSDQGFNGSINLRIPLGAPTRKARENCIAMGHRDQLRSHFLWVQEQYEAGIITRSAVTDAAAQLGIQLAPEQPSSLQEGFTLSIK